VTGKGNSTIIRGASGVDAMLAHWKAKPRVLLKIVGAILAVPTAYVLSYFLLGRHTTGETFVLGHPVTGRYVYHDRHYDFDPSIYIPLAKLECKLRGGDTQVVLDGSLGRDGSNQYMFWSGEAKF
jgi:hypothetical protein